MKKKILFFVCFLILPAGTYYVLNGYSTDNNLKEFLRQFQTSSTSERARLAAIIGNSNTPFCEKLALAAEERALHQVVYDPSYRKIDYPGGDVPPDRGVCADVVIRSFRRLGIDLQVEVHKDMKNNFSVYPKIWGLKNPDTNIDHRRVPNLMVYFQRHGVPLPLSQNPSDYKPGDIVCYELSNKRPHVGIVSTKKTLTGKLYKLVHNIGAGPQIEDVLFDWKIIGHFRYPVRSPT